MADKLIDTSTLPTHVALVARRYNAVARDEGSDAFLMMSYVVEAAIKTIGIVLQANLKERSPEHSYRVGFNLARADGLGLWDAAIREMTQTPVATFLSPDVRSLLVWLTQKQTGENAVEFKDAKAAVEDILALLGVQGTRANRSPSCRDLITNLVEVRNKTKAHGAVGEDFFAAATSSYLRATRFLLEAPVFSWVWLHLSIRQSKGNVRAIDLRGLDLKDLHAADTEGLRPETPGVYFRPGSPPKAYPCAPFLSSNRECTKFFVPNGGYTDSGSAEFIDYSSGEVSKIDLEAYALPPAPLPRSETDGREFLDVQSNVFGNLPTAPAGYVERPELEEALLTRLLDRNHAIITLHGRGGIGKTSLALTAVHRLAAQASPRFDHIVWLSARDIDLRPSGPAPVRPTVTDVSSVAKAYGRLFGVQESVEAFSAVLQSSRAQSETGILFVFDNFETLLDATALHRFLDAHTHQPNKVLITSRERAFKADYPIEVGGMSRDQAFRLMENVAAELRIEGLLTPDVSESIYGYTEGHAYAIRVILGEIQKERRYVPAKQVMTRRLDIVDAVFERSFTRLSESGRLVFLCVTNWKSAVPELALIVVLSEANVDVEAGVDECSRMSLISYEELGDGQPAYSAPSLARLFGTKKLQGDPDRLVIQSYLNLLHQFGVVGQGGRHRVSQDDAMTKFASWLSDPGRSEEGLDSSKVDRILERVAELWPRGWSRLAKFREQVGASHQDVEYALRRAAEEMPADPDVWLTRAEYAARIGDDATRIASLVSLVDADASNVSTALRVAADLTRYLSAHKLEIPRARRGVYVASVRAHLERLVHKLDADGLSRLAWLFLLEDDRSSACRYAQRGLDLEADNEYCRNILERNQ